MEGSNDLRQALKETIMESVGGTVYAPPEGAILVDATIIMGWYYADGSYGSSYITCGAPWSGHGLVTRCAQGMEATLANELNED